MKLVKDLRNKDLEILKALNQTHFLQMTKSQLYEYIFKNYLPKLPIFNSIHLVNKADLINYICYMKLKENPQLNSILEMIK